MAGTSFVDELGVLRDYTADDIGNLQARVAGLADALGVDYEDLQERIELLESMKFDMAAGLSIASRFGCADATERAAMQIVYGLGQNTLSGFVLTDVWADWQYGAQETVATADTIPVQRVGMQDMAARFAALKSVFVA